MLYPQNGDRIVTIDSVSSLYPVYIVSENTSTTAEILKLEFYTPNGDSSLGTTTKLPNSVTPLPSSGLYTG